MPTTATTCRPIATALGHQERKVLHAVGCGLRDDEIAAALALSEDAVAGHLARVLVKLALRDRAAAIVHAFDSGLVVPGSGPRTQAASPAPRAPTRRDAGPTMQISLLGPLQAWQDGRPLKLGHLRQQAVLAALALCAGRTVGQQELLDGVWGTDSPVTNVVPVYIYRLRRTLRAGDGRPDAVIEHDRFGYRLVSGLVDVDVSRMEELVTDIATADRAGEPAEAVRLCSQALDLFRGEPLAGPARAARRAGAVAAHRAPDHHRAAEAGVAAAAGAALRSGRRTVRPVRGPPPARAGGRAADAGAVPQRPTGRRADRVRPGPPSPGRRTRRSSG